MSIAIALLGAVLVSTRSATPTVEPPAVIVAGLQGDIATSAGPSQSAAIAQATLASALDAMFQPARQEDSPAAAGTDKSPAFALTQDRAGDKLTVAARSEPPSHEVRMAKTIALIRPAAPHSNTLHPNTTMLSPGDRHAGSVLSVGPDSVVVHEVGRAGEEHKLHVSITRKTRIIESRRNPAISDAQDSFTDEAISLADVNKGDYVIVRASREGANLVATSVTVTRRPETKIVRPGSDSAAPPPTLEIERRKQSSAPTVSATGPAQPAASDGQDSQAVIEWLFSPASVPKQ